MNLCCELLPQHPERNVLPHALHFQAWLKHSRMLFKELGTFAAQLLAQRFYADASATDWSRFGRLHALREAVSNSESPQVGR